MQRERDRETGGKAKSEKKERQNQRVKRVRGTQRESLIDREPGTYRVTEIEIKGDNEGKDKRQREILEILDNTIRSPMYIMYAELIFFPAGPNILPKFSF